MGKCSEGNPPFFPGISQDSEILYPIPLSLTLASGNRTLLSFLNLELLTLPVTRFLLHVTRCTLHSLSAAGGLLVSDTRKQKKHYIYSMIFSNMKKLFILISLSLIPLLTYGQQNFASISFGASVPMSYYGGTGDRPQRSTAVSRVRLFPVGQKSPRAAGPPCTVRRTPAQ